MSEKVMAGSREAARTIAQDLALMGFAAVRAGEVAAYVRGVRDALAGARAAVADRRPLARETYARIRSVRALKPSILARIRRHVTEQLI